MVPEEGRNIARNTLKDTNMHFSDQDEGIKLKFKPYSEIIENLTNSFIVETNNPDGDSDLVIECMLTKDEHSLIVILKNSDELYLIRVLSAASFRQQLEIRLEGEYIKAANIVQNFNGSVFCVPYLKDGEFNVVTFTTRRLLDDVNLSKKLNYSIYIRPNDNLEFPMIDACFVDAKNIQGENLILTGPERKRQQKIFINMFITKTCNMASIIYDYQTAQITTEEAITEIQQTNGVHKNFPIGTFFDEKRFMVYVVYR